MRKSLAAVLLAIVCATALMLFAACSGNKELTYVEAQAPTCTEEGHTAYYTDGEKYYSDESGETEISLADTVVDATGHSMNFNAAVPSTCTEDGTVAYYECSNCHKTFADEAGTKELDDVADYASHVLQHFDAVAPSIDADGNYEYWHCEVCGGYFLSAEASEEVELADTVIEKLPEYAVEISVSVTDASGEAVTDYSSLTDAVTLTLTGEGYAKVYTAKVTAAGKLEFTADDGGSAGSEMGAGEYIVSYEGYYQSSLTVGETENQQLTVYLDEIEHTLTNPNTDHPEYVTFVRGEDGSHGLTFNTPWGTDTENAVIVDIEDAAVTGEYYMADFVVKMPGGYDTSWQSRFSVLVAQAEGNTACGFKVTVTGDDAQLNIHQGNNIMASMDGIAIKTETSFRAAITGEGLYVRAVRAGTSAALYFSYDGGETWEQIYTVTLGEGLGARFAFMAVNDTFEISEPVFAEYVPQVDPTLTETGVAAHFAAGEALYTLGGAVTTVEELIIDELVEQDISLTLTLKKEDKELPIPEELQITLSMLGATYTVGVGEDGVVEIEKMAVGTYTVTAAGYESGTLVVTADTTTAEITLYLVQHSIVSEGVTGGITVVRDPATEKNVYTFNSSWDKVATVDILDENIAGENYMVEFTLNMPNNSGDWFTRAIFTMGTSADSGFIIINNGSVYFAEGFNVYANNGAEIKTDSYGFAAASKAGLPVRLVRSGAAVRLYMNFGEGYQLVHSLTIAGESGARFAVSVSNNDKDVSISGIKIYEYSAPVAPDVGQEGSIGYYTDGTNYFDLTGSAIEQEDTVLDALVEQEVEVSVTVTLQGEPADAETIGSLTFTLAHENGVTVYEDISLVDGKLDVSELVKGTYTVTASDSRFDSATLVVDGASAEITVNMPRYRVVSGSGVTIDDGELTFNSAWDSVTTVDVFDENIAGENYMVELTLKMPSNSGDWMSRVLLTMADGSDGNIGFILLNNAADGSVWWQNAFNVYSTEDGGEKKISGFQSASMGTGVLLRLIRSGDSVYLYANTGSAWSLIHSLTLPEGRGARFALSASNNETIVLSGIKIYEYSAPVAPEVGEAGSIGYYTDGTNYFDLTGAAIEQSEIAIPALEGQEIEVSVTVTLQGEPADAETSGSLTFTLAHENGVTVYEDIAIVDGKLDVSELVKGTYTVTASDSRFDSATLVVDGASAEITVNMPRYRVVSGSGVTIDDGELTFNSAWDSVTTVDVFDENIAGENYMVEFTLNMPNNSGDWFTRAIFTMGTSADSGFIIINNGSVYFAEGFNVYANNGAEIKTDSYGFAAASKAGLPVRLVRSGAAVRLYMNFGEGYQLVHSLTIAGESGARFAVSVSNNDADVSISGVSVYEYVESVAPDVGQEGSIAYFTDGTNKFNTAGEAVTDEEIVIPAEEQAE